MPGVFSKSVKMIINKKGNPKQLFIPPPPQLTLDPARLLSPRQNTGTATVLSIRLIIGWAQESQGL